MTPGERADGVAETYAQAFECDAEAVAEHDRVAANLEIVRGGWQIMIGGRCVAVVGDDGTQMAMLTASAIKEIVARRAA